MLKNRANSFLFSQISISSVVLMSALNCQIVFAEQLDYDPNAPSIPTTNGHYPIGIGWQYEEFDDNETKTYKVTLESCALFRVTDYFIADDQFKASVDGGPSQQSEPIAGEPLNPIGDQNGENGWEDPQYHGLTIKLKPGTHTIAVTILSDDKPFWCIYKTRSHSL